MPTAFCPTSGCGAATDYPAIKPTHCPKCHQPFAAAFKVTPTPVMVAPPPAVARQVPSNRAKHRVSDHLRGDVTARAPQRGRPFGMPAEIEWEGSPASSDEADAGVDDPNVLPLKPDDPEVQALAAKMLAELNLDESGVITQTGEERDEVVRLSDWTKRPPLAR